jgi:hypothetical protein
MVSNTDSLKKALQHLQEVERESHRPKKRAYNQPAPEKRLWVLGRFYPRGQVGSEIIDDRIDLDQEKLDSLNVTGLPMTSHHNYDVEMGFIVKQYRDKQGGHYLLGYIDDSTPEGKQAQGEIRDRKALEFSLANFEIIAEEKSRVKKNNNKNGSEKGDNNGEKRKKSFSSPDFPSSSSSTLPPPNEGEKGESEYTYEYKLHKQLLPAHVSIVDKGRKSNCHLLYACEQDMSPEVKGKESEMKLIYSNDQKLSIVDIDRLTESKGLR